MNRGSTGNIYCPHCGRPVPSKNRFCSHCGSGMESAVPPSPQALQYQTPAYYPPQPARTGLSTGCIVGIVLAVVLPFVGIVFAVSIPNYLMIKEKAKGAETKSDLHTIQLAVERFSVDHDNQYPQYLIGGEGRFANEVVTTGGVSPFRGIEDCPNQALLSDPLLREGYLYEYARNPFVRDGASIHVVQCNLPSSQTGCDPLANEYEDGYERGTRFGAQCNLMGNVMADPRFDEFTVTDPATGNEVTKHTWADVEYEFWDMWIGDKPLPYLPGHFFYKSNGPATSGGIEFNPGGEPFDISLNQVTVPGSIDCYILGAYGGIREKGKDVLGVEQPLPYCCSHPDNPEDRITVDFWLWTRSEVSNDPDDREGSPYRPASGASPGQPLEFGNPNGIRDAVILVLTASP